MYTRYSLFDPEAAVGFYSIDLTSPEDRLIMRVRNYAFMHARARR